MIEVIFLLLPFIQLGVSYWASVATVVAVLVCAIFHADKTLSDVTLRGPNLLLVAFVIGCIALSYLDLAPRDPLLDTLAALRIVLLWIITFSLVAKSRSPDAIRFKPTAHFPALLAASAGAMLVLVAVQLVRLKSGYFGLPQEWFCTNNDTLPGELDILYSNIRPFGTFGEPSYLGFYCLSLVMVSTGMCRYRPAARWGRVSMVFLVAAGLLSQSLAFLVAIIVMGGVALAEKSFDWRRGRAQVVFVALVLLPLLGLGGWVALEVVDGGRNRLAVILSGSDESTNVRVIAPLQVAFAYLAQHPLGLPRTRMLEELGRVATGFMKASEFKTDNAILATLYQCGLAGALMLGRYMASAFDVRVAAYMFLSLNFNGDIFATDKFAIVAFSIALYAWYSRVGQVAPRSAVISPIRKFDRAITAFN